MKALSRTTLEAPVTGPFVCPSDHPHGESQVCRHHKCSCEDCRVAHNKRMRDRRKQIAYGRGSMVDATPAREHIVKLRAQSMGVKTIARLAGVPVATVGSVMWGRDGRKPPERIQRRTADGILAVDYQIEDLAPAAMIDVTPTRRRLQALACVGWTWTAIESRSELSTRLIGEIVSRRRVKVRAETARTVSELYDRLWDEKPPARNAHSASKIGIAKRRAAREGWVSPLGWDDIDTDPEPPTVETEDEPFVDDIKVERVLRGERHQLNRDEKAALVVIAHRRRWSDTRIGDTAHLAEKTVAALRAELGLTAWDQTQMAHPDEDAA